MEGNDWGAGFWPQSSSLSAQFSLLLLPPTLPFPYLLRSLASEPFTPLSLEEWGP